MSQIAGHLICRTIDQAAGTLYDIPIPDVLNRRLPGQTITSAEAIPPGAAIVLRDLTGEGFGAALVGGQFEGIVQRDRARRGASGG